MQTETETNQRFAAQLPRNLAANIAYFLANVVIGVLLIPYFIMHREANREHGSSPVYYLVVEESTGKAALPPIACYAPLSVSGGEAL